MSHNGSMWKGNILLGIVLPSPQRTLEAQMCCNIAGSSYRTAKFSIVALGPSKTRPGQTDYMCTVYSSDATLISGNKSITAAQATSLPPPPPPPTPPKCAYTTAHTCIMSGKCFWSAGKCSPTPPSSLNCATIGEMSTKIGMSLCMSMTLFDSDPSSTNSSEIMAPSQYKAGVLGNFNWSFGVVNNVTRVTKTAPQIVKPDGNVHYWSISTGLVKNASSPSGVSANSFYAGVQYEEIISGKQSKSTAFNYILTGNALSMIDMQGPGHVGNVTGKTVMTETPFAFAFQMVFWPNITNTKPLQ